MKSRILVALGFLYLLASCASSTPPLPMTFIDECKNNAWFLQYDSFKPADCFTSDGTGRVVEVKSYANRPHCYVCGPLCQHLGDFHETCKQCRKACRPDGPTCDSACFLRTPRGGGAPVFHCEVNC